MVEAREVSEAVFVNGAAVLMARIVGSTGRFIRPLQVERVEYSIRQLHPFKRRLFRRVRGHQAVPLVVQDVFFDTLRTGQLWDLDVTGYNFRHAIKAGRTRSFPKPGALYEIRYTVWPKDCDEPVLIRFRVRMNHYGEEQTL